MTRPPSLETVMRVLQSGTRLSDVELAYELGCRRGLVSTARASLGMPPMPLPASAPDMTDEQRVMLGAVLTSGGHRRWIGRVTRDGVPLLDAHRTVARVIFRMTHGREPEGVVRVDCLRKHCVEGTHLTDRVMRADRAALDDLAGAL